MPFSEQLPEHRHRFLGTIFLVARHEHHVFPLPRPGFPLENQMRLGRC